MVPVTSEDVARCFVDSPLVEEELSYLRYHASRIAYTVNLVRRFLGSERPGRILDVGPHFLTYCLRNLLVPAPVISTLGYANARLFPPALVTRHYEMDLNKCREAVVAQADAVHDLVVFSETIEHLYTSPSVVLPFLARFLRPGTGCGLLIQTPNAASLSKRIALLRGRNPYEKIRIDTNNPGHFREYTMSELEGYTAEAGFSTWHREYCSYWPGSGLRGRVGDRFPPFREGITIVLVRP